MLGARPPESGETNTYEDGNARPERGCEVAVQAQLSSGGEGRPVLVAVAANQTERRIETTLVGPCPGPIARFDGLPNGYDLGDRCRAGACAGGPTSRHPFVLLPGERREVARVSLDWGEGACNAPLTPGRYSIGANIELAGVQTCSTSRVLLEHSPSAAQPPVPVRQPSVERKPRERQPCPAMACAYTPCPPGVPPPTGCAAACGCSGRAFAPAVLAAGPPATLVPGVSTSCPPDQKPVAEASVEVRLAYDIGGCPVESNAAPVPSAHAVAAAAVPRLEVLSSLAQVRGVARCAPGQAPGVDLTRDTYIVLYDVLPSSDRYELVAAKDDGHQVHVALRATRACQGVAPVQNLSASVLRVAGKRPVRVQRCAPRYPVCGAIP